MKKINWLDQIANLLVVILGISIAFWLESYKEEVGNKEKERKYLESLLSDLEVDIETLDTLIYYNKTMKASLNNLSMASIGNSYGTDSALMWHTMSIQYNPPFTAQRASYESLKSSGTMELIGDFDLRNKIVEIYEQYYRAAGEYDEVLNHHVRDFVKPYYMRKIQYVAAGKLDPSFLYETEFKNLIFAYMYLFSRKDEYYQQVRERVFNIKQEIEEYLAGK